MAEPLLPNLSLQQSDATAPPAPAATSTSLGQAGDLLFTAFTAPRRWATAAYNASCKGLGWEAQELQAEPHTVFEMWSAKRCAAGLSPRPHAPAATASRSPPPTPAQPASEDGSECSQASSTHQHPGSPATVLDTSQSLIKVAQQVQLLLAVSSEQSTPSEAASDSVHSMGGSADSNPEASPPAAAAFAAPAAAQPAAAAPAKPHKERKQRGIHPAASFALHAVVLAAAVGAAGVATSRHRRGSWKDKRSSWPAHRGVAF